MRRRGLNQSAGTTSTFDRSGTSVSPILRPQVHPFFVNCMGLENGKVVFSINEGRVYPGSGLEAGNIKIDLGTVTPVPSPFVTGSILELTDDNLGMTYTAALASGTKYLYVRIARATISEEWKMDLVCKTSVDAAAEVAANPATMAPTGETSLGNASHGGFPLNMVAAAGMCGMTYTLTVEQLGKKFRASSAWIGTFQYPIATFTKIADTAVCRQILRSDVFFHGTRTFSVEYIDTAVTQISLEASGTCPCGGGCGCGGCGGCGGCCGCGTCTCGGGCGCTGCGCP